MIFLLCVCALLGQDKLDRTDAAAVARAVLTAYKAKDLDALGALSNATNREILKELKEQGEKHPRYKSILASGRYAAVSKWDGKTATPRYPGDGSATVLFGETETPGKVVVVVLEWENNGWAFEDVKFPTRENFEKGAVDAPKR